jgi:hypothetical protein
MVGIQAYREGRQRDRLRNVVSRLGSALAGALLIAALAAVGAQAVSISPDDTQLTGTADNPTFNYGTRVVQCDSATATGTTGRDSPAVFVEIEFQEPCSLQPVGLNATRECNDGEFTELEATTADTNQGVVDELHEGFECRLVMSGVCDHDRPAGSAPSRWHERRGPSQ